ncbi:MAG: tyrosine--tRNA ligase [Theionarchaea archaeon]|nr:tyrosine--tRNA ligase [Theionarchaea archaeon]
MDLEERLDLICRKPAEEVVTRNELRTLLETKEHPVAYQGFEPSGKAHLGTGIVAALKTKDLMDAGIKFKLFLAEWHAWINNKMGGDLEAIRRVGEYFQKVWLSLGVPETVEFVWSSEFVDDSEYWGRIIKVLKESTVARITRCLTIMGRKEAELQEAAQYVYPAMQVSDIYQMELDIACSGMDQRKAHMLARDVGPKLGLPKPVAVHSHLLAGLQGPIKMGGFDEDETIDQEISSKMAKSHPETCIFAHDSEKEIREKIRKAYCPAGEVEGNPVMEIVDNILFRGMEREFTIERPAKFGGDVTYWQYGELKKDFAENKLHPQDLKNKVSAELNSLIAPCRKYFEAHPEYLEVFQEQTITR